MAKVVVANRLVREGKTFKGGDVIDVSQAEARDLLARHKVRPHVEKASDVPAPKPDVPAVKGAKNG